MCIGINLMSAVDRKIYLIERLTSGCNRLQKLSLVLPETGKTTAIFSAAEPDVSLMKIRSQTTHYFPRLEAIGPSKLNLRK